MFDGFPMVIVRDGKREEEEARDTQNGAFWGTQTGWRDSLRPKFGRIIRPLDSNELQEGGRGYNDQIEPIRGNQISLETIRKL